MELGLILRQARPGLSLYGSFWLPSWCVLEGREARVDVAWVRNGQGTFEGQLARRGSSSKTP